MFDINEFIMKTLKGMIGEYPDFQVREYALNWHEKGKLTEDDLADIDFIIEAQHAEAYTQEELAEAEADETETETTTEEQGTEEPVDEGTEA